jgi:hypothetical protein
MEKARIIDYFKEYSYSESNGLEVFLSESGKNEVFQRLENIEIEPLSKVQLNQLLLISGLTGMTFSFFKYYWLHIPDKHPYDVKKLVDFDEKFVANTEKITSLQHLRWGLMRIYTDSLLYYGNITNGFNHLNTMHFEELEVFFINKRFKTESLHIRGEALEFEKIPHEDRYLISEMACKTYEADFDSEESLKQFLIDNYREAKKQGRSRITVKELFEKDFISESKRKYENTLFQLEYSAADILDVELSTETDIETHYGQIAERFDKARQQALQNTKLYLSLIIDLDVYVATSMRNKQDFLEMATTCEKIFKDPKIKNFHLRYFDPTISAAYGHEDKGLIECLMVRCAKVLIYSAGIKESYGKDAEAAMALSSGKPVIFYCPDSNRADFYKKVHPLTKLIDFGTGVANGAMVTFQVQEVVELLRRIFNNFMEYKIEQPKKGYFRLIEISTDSAVRVQTNDELLTKSFWNYYERFIK